MWDVRGSGKTIYKRQKEEKEKIKEQAERNISSRCTQNIRQQKQELTHKNLLFTLL